jgi:hypothetical protein
MIVVGCLLNGLACICVIELYIIYFHNVLNKVLRLLSLHKLYRSKKLCLVLRKIKCSSGNMTSRLHEITTEHFMVKMLRKFRNGL